MAHTMTSTSSKVWLVTGAARGLGLALVQTLLSRGYRTVATARDISPLQRISDPNLLAVQLDVTSPSSAQAAIDSAITHFGRIDVLVNNAGYSDIAPFEQVTEESFRQEFEVNFWGVVNLARIVVPVMRRQRSGTILQISSVGAQACPAGRTPYAASKCAVEGFSESLAKEVSPLGVRVTIVEPGAFRTGFAETAHSAPQVMEEYAGTVGKAIEMQKGLSGNQGGDPVKAARAMIQLAEHDNPPIRLVLGKDAYGLVEAKNQMRVKEHEAWKETSLSTGFET